MILRVLLVVLLAAIGNIRLGESKIGTAIIVLGSSIDTCPPLSPPPASRHAAAMLTN